MLLPPVPIELSIGASVRQPKLIEIAKIGFPIFYYYETLLVITPKDIYEMMMGEKGKDIWDRLSDERKESISVYDVIESEEWLQKAYLQVFNFFFDKPVKYLSFDDAGFFVFVKDEEMNIEELDIENDIYGAISRESFPHVLDVIQYVCCMKGDDDEEEDESEIKFKNNKARQIYEKMKKARERKKQARKNDPNFSLINIISAVSNKHPTISPLNVWDLTIVQLLDCFSRLQFNAIGDLQAVTVAVWGDEKKQFDPAFWYKNEHDK